MSAHEYFAHPMFHAHKQARVNGMGDWWTDITDPIVDTVLVDWVGLDPDDVDTIKAEAGAAATKELNKELESQAQQLVASITGTTVKAPTTVKVPTGIQQQIEALNKNPVLQAIPGGIYTLAGVAGGLILYVMLRK